MAWPYSRLQREVLAGMHSMLPSSISMFLDGRRELREFNAVSKQLQRAYHCSRIGVGDAYNNLGGLNIVYSITELHAWPNSFDERFTFVGSFLDDRGAKPAFPFDEVGDQPMIYISLGTIFNARADFYRLCFEAFANSEYRVVMAIGDKTDPQLLGEIPANFIVRPSVPQLEILRRAALFITHGGMNSVNEGLAADTPLLLIPQGADQFLIARRIQQLGAGKMLRREKLNAEGLRDAAKTILADPAYHRQSTRLGVRLRATGGPPAAADAIETYKQALGI
jgi:MGT family glycosyltransferase